MDLHEVTDFLKNEYTGEKPGTYDSKVWDFDSKNQGLATRKCYSYDPKYNFNGAKHRFFI